MCAPSRIFRAGPDPREGSDGHPISLCDRVPPGHYALVRGVSHGSLWTAGAYAATYGLRGLILQLGDAETGPPLPASRGLGATPEQLLYADTVDSLLARSPFVGEMPGPVTFRARGLAFGVSMRMGSWALKYPAAAGTELAELRNRTGADFAVADLDTPAWRTDPRAGYAAVVLSAAAQKQFRKSDYAPGTPRLSAHYPLFLTLPQSPASSPGFLSPGGAFEPTANGFTGPKTFPMPRVAAGASASALATAWTWARPWDSAGGSVTQLAVMVDARSGGNVGSVSDLSTDEDPNGGLTVVHPTSSRPFYSVHTGMVVFDDLMAVVARLGIGLGRRPTTWWDFDGPANVTQGIWVPSWSPDPPPVATVDAPWRDPSLGAGLVLELENWKCGHTGGGSGYLPDRVIISGPACAPYRSPVRSWMTWCGQWMTAPAAFSAFDHKVDGLVHTFAGTPSRGDEGLYPLLIEVTGVQGQPGLPVFGRTQMSTSVRVFPRPDAGVAYRPSPPESVPGAGQLHHGGATTDWGHRVPHEWLSADQWCYGAGADSTYVGSVRPSPGGQPVRQNTTVAKALACGSSYIPEHLYTLLDVCNRYGSGAIAPVCNTFESVAEWLGFVYGAAVALTGNDYANLDTDGRGGPYDMMPVPTAVATARAALDPAFMVDLAAPYLYNAWVDANNALSPCFPAIYSQRVTHALTHFADQTGSFPGAHGYDYYPNGSVHHGRGCDSLGLSVSLMMRLPAAIVAAECMKQLIMAGGLVTPPTSGGQTGGGDPPTSGLIPCPVDPGTAVIIDGGRCDDHLASSSRCGCPALDLSGVSGITTGVYPIRSVCSGTLSFRDWDPRPGGGLGIYAETACSDGRRFRYSHLDPASLSLSPAPGSSVSQGTLIGLMGTTGYSDGVHLHFEAWNSAGDAVCPEGLLPSGCP